MISETVAAQSSTVAKSSSIVVIAGGSGVRRTQAAVDEPDRALGADDHPTEVVAGRLRALGAEARHGPVPEHDVERQDVRGRDAVREAVRAAGVRPHVAADRRHLLRGRVRHVRESRTAEGDAEIEVEQAGLDPRQSVLGPDLEDAVHLRRDDHEGVADRCGRAREPGAAPARHHREVVHRGRRGRTRRRRRRSEGRPRAGRALDHRRIACVQAERQGVREHLVRTERFLELPSRRVQIRHRR